jgi:hypothetical protein
MEEDAESLRCRACGCRAGILRRYFAVARITPANFSQNFACRTRITRLKVNVPHDLKKENRAIREK